MKIVFYHEITRLFCVLQIVHLHKVWPKHIRYPDHEKTSTVNYELSVAKEDVRLVGKDFLAFPPIIREEDIEPKKIEIKTFLF